ncbi:MAG: hypothetical protein ACP5FH_00395 [Terracidiphilus sp.]
MADWKIAYDWMMENEDASRACAQRQDSPSGALIISGINSQIWPAEFAAIAALPQEQREPLIRRFYEDHFWNIWYVQLDSDEVAKRVFDFAVNAGSVASVRCLQQAVNSLTPPGGALLLDDGSWGPITVDEANRTDPAMLVAAFRAARVGCCQAIAAGDPAKRKHLAAWLARAEK